MAREGAKSSRDSSSSVIFAFFGSSPCNQPSPGNWNPKLQPCCSPAREGRDPFILRSMSSRCSRSGRQSYLPNLGIHYCFPCPRDWVMQVPTDPFFATRIVFLRSETGATHIPELTRTHRAIRCCFPPRARLTSTANPSPHDERDCPFPDLAPAGWPRRASLTRVHFGFRNQAARPGRPFCFPTRAVTPPRLGETPPRGAAARARTAPVFVSVFRFRP
mgnify:CR=1 FL=1